MPLNRAISRLAAVASIRRHRRQLTNTPYFREISGARKTQRSGSKFRTPVTPTQALITLRLTRWYLRWFLVSFRPSFLALIAVKVAIEVRVSSCRILDEFSIQTRVEQNSRRGMKLREFLNGWFKSL